jgi:hypothetical protein
MRASQNIPYVKQYDENGNVLNKIDEAYISYGPNRKERRDNEPRFRGNHRGHSFTVTPQGKYRRVIQLAYNKKKGYVVAIKHYLAD